MSENIDRNPNYANNVPRRERAIKYASSAARQIPGAAVYVSEDAGPDLCTVRLTLPLPSELNKIASHYLCRAAYAADRTELGPDGFTFTVDMTQPYED